MYFNIYYNMLVWFIVGLVDYGKNHNHDYFGQY